MDSMKKMFKVEREVLFYGDDGRIVAKETKYRGKYGLARFTVEYLIGEEWTCRSDAALPETVAMVKAYRDERCMH